MPNDEDVGEEDAAEESVRLNFGGDVVVNVGSFVGARESLSKKIKGLSEGSDLGLGASSSSQGLEDGGGTSSNNGNVVVASETEQECVSLGGGQEGKSRTGAVAIASSKGKERINFDFALIKVRFC